MVSQEANALYAALPFAVSAPNSPADESDSEDYSRDKQHEIDLEDQSYATHPQNEAQANGKSVSQQKRKKKATRACFHCQKAHLTCDDARPCARCVKRNLGDSCHDGKRKKAKYLHDFDESEVLGKRNSPSGSSSRPFSNLPETAHHTEQPYHHQAATLFHDDNAPEFESRAATSEYAVLSSMLNGDLSTLNGSSSFDFLPRPPNAPSFFQPSLMTSTSINPPALSGTSHLFGNFSPSSPFPQVSALLPHSTYSEPSPSASSRSAPLPSTLTSHSHNSETSAPDPSLTLDLGESGILRTASGAMRAEDVYKFITKPFPYAQSYHHLIKHMKDNFDKNDILRVVRALAVFRPSLIALQMPLTDEDEVFAEKCFQRTLIEFDKLISFTATPSVVWRRTGEICLIGVEFALLTKWDRAELLKQKRSIFELFDQQSTVEYYEAFATHAFDNSTQNVMSTCVLLTPDQKPVPCSFCFTIKRDLFNCPSAVLGQFLPLLQ